jgi:hypothetical protein
MNDEQLILILREDLKEIKKDIKVLLAFKNKIYGVILTSSVLISLAVNVGVKYLP